MPINIEEVDVKGDEIIFTVKNNSNKEVRYTGVSVEKEINKKWSLVRTDIDCPCMAKCKKAILPLKAKYIRKHFWDKKDNKCSNEANGIYRFVIYGGWNEKTNSLNMLGKSRSFEID